MRKIIFAVATATFAASAARAGDSAWLADAISSAKSGAVIDIPSGDYDLTDQKIHKSITLKGSADGKTVFRSAAVTASARSLPSPRSRWRCPLPTLPHSAPNARRCTARTGSPSPASRSAPPPAR